MARFLDDDVKSNKIRVAIEQHLLHNILETKEVALIEYSKKLTTRPAAITAEDIDYLRSKGVDDGEILEINQVVAYFNYANRTVLGLGVNLLGEELIGLSPNNKSDSGSWSHQ